MNPVFERKRKFRKQLAAAVLVASGLMLMCVLPAAAQSQRYILQAGGFAGAGGTTSSPSFGLSWAVGVPGGAMSSENFGLSGRFWRGGAVCLVGVDDFAKFAEYWLAEGPGIPADLDSDGDVDFEDLSRLADLWLSCCPADWPMK